MFQWTHKVSPNFGSHHPKRRKHRRHLLKFWTRGRAQAWPKAVNEDLGAKMGYHKGCQKKPASKCKKGPALGKAVEVDPDVDGPGPWVTLSTTVGHQPPRVY